MRDIYRMIVGIIGFFSVGMQYWLHVDDRSGAAFAASTINFFSFFTIQTNIPTAAAMLLPVVAPDSGLGRFLARPPVRTAIAGYIIVVGIVYFVLLRNLGHPQGWTLYLEYLLHYVMPPLFVLDWLLFVPKGEVAWRNGLVSLGFPAAYIVWTLTHGALTGWYPYPFVDVPELGYPRALMNIAGLVAGFLALDLLLVAVDRAMWRRGQSSALS